MRLLTAIVSLAAIPAIAAEPFTAHVVSFHDGDTLTVLDDDREVRVRLHG
jgi:endonuclease YncB( thermonuclease family)